jgi:myo-inositol-1(or 4)-monophosphatase
LERAAVRAAREAASILRKFDRRRPKVAFKGEVDLVTEADVASQRVILSTIGKAFPSHSILAEEGHHGHDSPLEGPIWVIDPLDGTTNFAHGFPMFSISIAFRERGETRFALVYHPLLDEMFLAHKGGGATLNGRAISVSGNRVLSEALLATGFPYDRRTSPENNLDLFAHFELSAQCVRRAGSAALDLANLSAGRLDGFWEPKLAAWDIAAGILLVEEAGGKVTDYAGRPLTDLRCGEIVASNGLLHRKLVSGVQSVRARRA